MEQALTACYASADGGNKSGSKLPILPGTSACCCQELCKLD